MSAITRDNETGEIKVYRGKNLSIGIHEDWSMLSWVDDNDKCQTETIDHNKYYITCM